MIDVAVNKYNGAVFVFLWLVMWRILIMTPKKLVSPHGWEQALSLVWMLESIANFSHEDAIHAVCKLIGCSPNDWEKMISDSSWFIGDARWNRHEEIESSWNRKFAGITQVFLDENAWHLPVWKLLLKNKKMVFAANLSYLLQVSGRGSVARLAEFTGRARTTASKWGRWQDEGEDVRIPPTTLLPKILEFFDLRPSCDLYEEPLFLRRNEVRDSLLRIQGKHYLDSLSGEHLSLAVKKLEDESARQAKMKLKL